MKKHRELVENFGQLLDRQKTEQSAELRAADAKSLASLVSELVVHTSDLSSPAKVWAISQAWSIRVNTEFKE